MQETNPVYKQNAHQFKASFDMLTKVITICVIILFITIGMISVRSLATAPGDATDVFALSVVLFFPVATLVVSYLFSTQYYLIRNNEFVIKRLIGEKRISIPDIDEIRLVAKGEMRGTIRTFGSGGLFGYYGKFYNKTLGSMTFYTTRRTNRVYIRTKGGNKIIISPDDLNFVDALKSNRS